MEKNISGLLTVVAIVCLVLVGLAYGTGYSVGQGDVQTETVTETKTVYQNVSVDKIVEVTAPNQLDLAVAEFLQAVEDEEDEAGHDVILSDYYDSDETELSKVYDEYTITVDGDETIVEFSVKMKFKEEDETSERIRYYVTVILEEDEDTEVLIV